MAVTLVVGIAGALAGAVGLSVLAALLHAGLAPESYGQGQFGMGFAYTIPLGILLGSTTGIVVREARRGHRARAGWIATVGGTLALALATTVVWGSTASKDGGFADFMSTLLSMWIGPSWFAGAALTIGGMLELMRRGRLTGRR